MSARSRELRLELDRADRAYRPGEPVRGRLWVEGRRRRELELSLRWRTSGKGNVDEGQPISLPSIEEPPGSGTAGARSYELSFPAPPGPPTYHGTLLQVDWLLRAEAGPDWTEEDLVLEGARETLISGRARARSPRRRWRALPRASALGGLAAVLGAPLLVWLAHRWTDGELLIPCGVFGAVMLVAGVRALRNPVAELRLGPVHLEHAEEVSPGEGVQVSLRLRPPGALRVNGISLRLVGEERATSGSGSGSKTHTHPFLVREQRLCQRQELHGELSLEAELPLPPDAPPSFTAPDNVVAYRLELRVDIPGWPDWHADVPLLVLPTGQAARRRLKLDLQPRQRCPYCRDALAGSPEPLLVCEGCETVLHEPCWDEVGRCPTLGCGWERPRHGRVRARG